MQSTIYTGNNVKEAIHTYKKRYHPFCCINNYRKEEKKTLKTKAGWVGSKD